MREKDSIRRIAEASPAAGGRPVCQLNGIRQTNNATKTRTGTVSWGLTGGTKITSTITKKLRRPTPYEK